jgi:hypothetical protein
MCDTRHAHLCGLTPVIELVQWQDHVGRWWKKENEVSNEQRVLHDLLNSLTVITAHCELLKDSACEEGNRRLMLILHEAHRMAQAINHEQDRCLQIFGTERQDVAGQQNEAAFGSQF